MYIFLDVDGVLNKKSDGIRPFSLNDECIGNFRELIGQIFNPKIVLTSTWRNGISRDGSRASHVEEPLQTLKEVGINIIDKTANAPDGRRNKEIDYYLRRHEKDEYIILDDDPSLFEEGYNTGHLYVIDCKNGLTKKDVKKIIKNISA